jgi:hypothetical protein
MLHLRLARSAQELRPQTAISHRRFARAYASQARAKSRLFGHLLARARARIRDLPPHVPSWPLVCQFQPIYQSSRQSRCQLRRRPRGFPIVAAPRELSRQQSDSDNSCGAGKTAARISAERPRKLCFQPAPVESQDARVFDANQRLARFRL